ncbi:hypothetical protein XENTR_v10020386 [Xenopus tropicalis]|nr:hypothetical protein XENTR_v10020386 [Xenopus tropicalis]
MLYRQSCILGSGSLATRKKNTDYMKTGATAAHELIAYENATTGTIGQSVLLQARPSVRCTPGKSLSFPAHSFASALSLCWFFSLSTANVSTDLSPDLRWPYTGSTTNQI